MNRITDAEINILNIIFEEPLTIKEIVLKTGKNISTVKTLVYRLVKKGIIGCDRYNNPYRYFSNVKKNEILLEKINQLVNNFFDGDIKEFKNYINGKY